MKTGKRLLALLLALAVALTSVACSGESAEGGGDTLTVSYAETTGFSGKFSPFFAETAADYDVLTMTGLPLLSCDRSGAVVYQGIEGETIAYGGTDYTYYGPADLTVTEHEDGTVYYDFTLREDLTFSDGVPVTVDDLIFSIYVLCDPTYDGQSTLCDAPIQGLAEYRQDNVVLARLLARLGEDNTDFTYVTAEQQDAFWGVVNDVMVPLAQSLVDDATALVNQPDREGNEPAEPVELTVAEAAAMYGYESLDAGATVKDFALTIGDSFGWDFAALETGFSGSGAQFSSDLIPEEVYGYSAINVNTGESVPNIAGIQKTGDYSLRVAATRVDISLIYLLGSVYIAPLHYYGDVDLYDYENNSFGFPKGDLSSVRAKNSQPLGAGPYCLTQYEGDDVRFEANESYYLGAPRTQYVCFREIPEEQWMEQQDGLLTGALDVSNFNYRTLSAGAVRQANDGELTGSVLAAEGVDTDTYFCVSIDPERVNVAGEPGSDTSRNLRRAFATIFAACRAAALEASGDAEQRIIEVPCSNTLWAVPQSSDGGWAAAFSVDTEGKSIYTDGMTEEERGSAAAQAALDFFAAAGCTVEGGMVVSGPEGADLAYEVQIAADSEDDPCLLLLLRAQETLAGIGVNLTFTNTFGSEDWNEWYYPEAGNCDMWISTWCNSDMLGLSGGAALMKPWFALADPDTPFYHIYCSAAPGEDETGFFYQDVYHMADSELDELILAARATTDQAARRSLYEQCLDRVNDWACAVPLYQQQDTILFSAQRINMDTVAGDITASYGWLREIQNVELN